ncbi:MAG: phosphoribosylaminoimidazolesuccinocarboxamide synthase [Rickettsiaceae bacterium H1]|nr:phosphoribosylaminoimidazolesuccinocarboxamide synthase [Rickettsiaceae bacterium H1]
MQILTKNVFPNKRKICEGKAKIIFATENDPNTVIQHFKDDITAFNNKKRSILPGKGVLNNCITSFFMSRLNNIGINTHFIKQLNMKEQLVKKVEMIPIEVVVRNVASGGICKRLQIKEGKHLDPSIIEFFYKISDDPLVTDEHIVHCLNLLSIWELEEIKMVSMRINDFLNGVFSTINISLIDFKLEFGHYNGQLFLADEISPDSCRLWDNTTNMKLDKDCYRLELGDVISRYKEVAKRLGIPIPILHEEKAENRKKNK